MALEHDEIRWKSASSQSDNFNVRDQPCLSDLN